MNGWVGVMGVTWSLSPARGKRRAWLAVVAAGLTLGCSGDGGGAPSGPAEDGAVSVEGVGASSNALLAAPGQAIEAGVNHTCVILEGGAIKCWGLNTWGQLGVGTALNLGGKVSHMGNGLPVVLLGPGGGVRQLELGTDMSCALLTSFDVKCWGENATGQLGLGDVHGRGTLPQHMGDNLPAIDVGTGRRVSELAVSFSHACVVLDTGNVKCWGHNTAGQLGVGDRVGRGDDPGEMGDNLPIVYLGAGRKAVSVVVSDGSSCALLDNAQVKCWGRNESGQLGQGDIQERGGAPGDMQALLPIDFGPGLTVKALSAGILSGHFCALFTTNQMKCWGENFSGALGLGDSNHRGDAPGEMGSALPFVNLGLNPTIKSIAVGDAHTCALLDLNESISGQITTNQVKCWGQNESGQLGQGDIRVRGDDPGEMGNALPLVPLGPGRSARAVSTGNHTLVVLDNGQVKAWGANGSGQLGMGHPWNLGDDPNEMGHLLPPVNLGSRAGTAVTVGAAHACVRLANGQVKCWGNNLFGRLGLGDTVIRGDDAGEMGDALPPVDLGTGRTAAVVSAGQESTCAVLAGGAVKCWGGNSRGQLGLGDTLPRGDEAAEMGDALATVALGTGKLAKAISNSSRHTCALLTSDGVKCWGDNRAGQLGLGDVMDRGDTAGEMGDALPLINFGARVPKAIATGVTSTCALFTSNEVACWGWGGVVGQGSTAVRGDQPGEMGTALLTVNLGTGLTAKAIAVGDYHACALLNTNQVKCWGENTYGQLGTGDTLHHGFTPGSMGDSLPTIPLGTSRSAKAVATGAESTCILLDTNQIKCFGRGNFGNLGVGDTQSRGDAANEVGDFAPTVFLGSGRSVVSMAVGSATCAALNTGELKCWGHNHEGQLGQGDRDRRGDQPGEMGDALPAILLGREL